MWSINNCMHYGNNVSWIVNLNHWLSNVTMDFKSNSFEPLYNIVNFSNYNIRIEHISDESWIMKPLAYNKNTIEPMKKCFIGNAINGNFVNVARWTGSFFVRKVEKNTFVDDMSTHLLSNGNYQFSTEFTSYQATSFGLSSKLPRSSQLYFPYIAKPSLRSSLARPRKNMNRPSSSTSTPSQEEGIPLRNILRPRQPVFTPRQPKNYSENEKMKILNRKRLFGQLTENERRRLNDWKRKQISIQRIGRVRQAIKEQLAREKLKERINSKNQQKRLNEKIKKVQTTNVLKRHKDYEKQLGRALTRNEFNDLDKQAEIDLKLALLNDKKETLVRQGHNKRNHAKHRNYLEFMEMGYRPGIDRIYSERIDINRKFHNKIQNKIKRKTEENRIEQERLERRRMNPITRVINTVRPHRPLM